MLNGQVPEQSPFLLLIAYGAREAQGLVKAGGSVAGIAPALVKMPEALERELFAIAIATGAGVGQFLFIRLLGQLPLAGAQGGQAKVAEHVCLDRAVFQLASQ